MVSYATVGAVTASSAGTSMTTTTLNVKGGWAEITSSSPITAHELTVFLFHHNVGAGQWTALVDIGTGGAGSEVVLVSNLLFSGAHRCVWNYVLPITIASGTRIAMRAQVFNASQTVKALIILTNNVAQYSSVATYGADISDSGGTEVSSGTTANTKGAYSQLTASTSARHRQLIVAIGNQGRGTRNEIGFQLDIATGAAGQEQVLIPDLRLFSDSAQDRLFPEWFGPIPCDIPAGTRLSARAQGNTLLDGHNKFDVVVYGVN